MKKNHQHRSLHHLLLALLFIFFCNIFSGCVIIADSNTQQKPQSRIQQKWLILLCKFPNQDREQNTIEYYQRMFTIAGIGQRGLYDYFQDVSYGQLDIGSSEVKGWYNLNHSVEQDQALSRGERIQRCIDVAKDVDDSKYFGVIVIRNENIDLGAYGSNVLLDYKTDSLSLAAHEMFHGMGLKHSYDDTQRKNSVWSAPGEYWDHWDIMSAANVHLYKKGAFAPSGPTLNAPNRDFMGFLKREQIYYYSKSKAPKSLSVELNTIEERPSELSSQYTMIQIEYPGTTTPHEHYYTIEFRMKEKWDSGIPKNTVLIHEVKKINGSLTSFLITTPKTEWLPGDVFRNGNLEISIESFNIFTKQASIKIEQMD